MLHIENKNLRAPDPLHGKQGCVLSLLACNKEKL